MALADRLTIRQELLRELGWVHVALNDLQEAAEKLDAASMLGEVDHEQGEANHRFAICKGHMKILAQVYRIFFAACRDQHNAVVVERQREEHRHVAKANAPEKPEEAPPADWNPGASRRRGRMTEK